MFFPTLSGGVRMAGSDTLTALECHDIRFPTSDRLDGPDAMNPAPDDSAAHVALRTTGGPRGHGLRFTIGRGNEVTTAAIRSRAPHLTGRPPGIRATPEVSLERLGVAAVGLVLLHDVEDPLRQVSATGRDLRGVRCPAQGDGAARPLRAPRRRPGGRPSPRI